MPPKILRRCSICANFHASYLVIDPQLGKGYYCYTCFRAWLVKNPPHPPVWSAEPCGQPPESGNNVKNKSKPD